MESPQLSWHVNTAIDLFDSAAVIFNPEDYGLRPAWAAGVRSRLSSSARETLQAVYPLPWLPITWFARLRNPAGAQDALDLLNTIPPEDRLIDLFELPAGPPAVQATVQSIINRETWDDGDLQIIRQESGEKASHKKNLKIWLDLLASGRRLGAIFLDGLREFHEIFYVEEELRVKPYLEKAVEAGQKMARSTALSDLLETLSQGIYDPGINKYRHITLAPSFWTTPLIAPCEIDQDHLYFIYGVRPSDVSLIPGDLVPSDLQQALKTLADPTRLKILRLLRQGPMTPGELARQLRLRPPTVTHHLQSLRQVRLVRITLSNDDRRSYEIRPDGLRGVWEGLANFLEL